MIHPATLPKLPGKLIREAGLVIIILFNIHWMAAQGVINTKISGTFHNLTIVEFLEILENRYQLIIYYEPDKVPFYRNSFEFDQVPLFEATGQFLKGSNLDLIKYRDHLVIANKDFITAKYIETLIARWQDGTYQKPVTSDAQKLHFYTGDSLNPSRENVIFSGIVRDKYTALPVIGAILTGNDGGTTTDENGSFTVVLLPGRYHWVVSYLGYRNIELDLHLYESADLNIDLEVFAHNLQEILVEATAQQDKVAETQIGIEMISSREIRELPSLLGEADVLKSIERLPGVNTISEASAGFYVRGGNIDQNLMLLDDGILFNASHALGFFSIFNPDAIRSVSLFKGNIPAQYGGRISSVLKTELKDGNPKKWRGNGAVSVAGARLAVDGPLSARTSVLAGARSSYSNWWLRLFRNPDIRNSRFSFNDFVLKISHQISDRHFLSASGYLSNDYFRFAQEFGYEWSTSLLNFKWRYLFNDRLSLATHFSSGHYYSTQFIPEGESASKILNGISNEKINTSLILQNQNHFFHFGFEGIRFRMDPEELTGYDAASDILPEKIDRDQGLELAIFINDEINITSRLSISAGLRLVQYFALGPGELRFYDPTLPRTINAITEIKSIEKNRKMVSYGGLEPRISASFQVSTDQSIKISYNRINQFIHLVSNTINPTPVDIWQVSNQFFKPQTGHNYSLGYFENIGENLNYSVEGFYKKIDGFPQFKDFADLLLNDYTETQLLVGQARSYGLELGAGWKLGRWNGTLAYTLSRSEAQTNGVFADEIINNNRWYPAHFDQPHQINFQLQHSIDPIQKIFLALTFKSGRPITVPIADYGVQNVLITHYSERNQFRIPSFQRLDFGYTIDRSEARLKGLRSSFTLSLINVLGRANPYTIYFRRNQDNIQRAYQLSILGSIFPSLNWNFTF